MDNIRIGLHTELLRDTSVGYCCAALSYGRVQIEFLHFPGLRGEHGMWCPCTPTRLSRHIAPALNTAPQQLLYLYHVALNIVPSQLHIVHSLFSTARHETSGDSRHMPGAESCGYNQSVFCYNQKDDLERELSLIHISEPTRPY